MPDAWEQEKKEVYLNPAPRTLGKLSLFRNRNKVGQPQKVVAERALAATLSCAHAASAGDKKQGDALTGVSTA